MSCQLCEGGGKEEGWCHFRIGIYSGGFVGWLGIESYRVGLFGFGFGGRGLVGG